jgi:hypothetical protein
VDGLLRIQLLAGEAEASFAAGQHFTVWADAIVDDDTIRGEGRLGDGVVVGQEPQLSTEMGVAVLAERR